MSIPRPTPTDILCTVDWRGTSNTTTTKESTRHWTRRHLPKYSCRERLTMMTIAAVAPLRPRPFGPPLRGRAALHDGSGNRWPCWPPRQEKERRRFYLKLVAPWSKIGGKRSLAVDSVSCFHAKPIRGRGYLCIQNISTGRGRCLFHLMKVQRP